MARRRGGRAGGRRSGAFGGAVRLDPGRARRRRRPRGAPPRGRRSQPGRRRPLRLRSAGRGRSQRRPPGGLARRGAPGGPGGDDQHGLRQQPAGHRPRLPRGAGRRRAGRARRGRGVDEPACPISSRARWGYRWEASRSSTRCTRTLSRPLSEMLMGETAERRPRSIASVREEQDPSRCAASIARPGLSAGLFDEETVPVEVAGKKGPEVLKREEHARPDTTSRGAGEASPVFHPPRGRNGDRRQSSGSPTARRRCGAVCGAGGGDGREAGGPHVGSPPREWIPT